MSLAPTRAAGASPVSLPNRVAVRRFLLSASPWLYVVALFFAGLGLRDLYSSHEARAAQNAQRMLDTGEWGHLVLFDGRADFQKPPGYYWAVAAIGWVNGGTVSEWVVRFPSAFSGLLCVLLVYAYLRADGRRTAATVAVFVLATANHFTGIARTARIDVPLTLAVAVALVAFSRGCRVPGRGTGLPGSSGLAWHFLSALAAGIAVMLKGPVALALVGPAAVTWLLVERRYTPVHLPVRSIVLGLLVVAAVALPWFIWMNAATDGEFLRVFFWHHTIARFTGSSPQLASHPAWYYFPRFAVDFLPWTPALVALVVWAVRTGRWGHDPALRFGAVTGAVMIAVLSAAKFKRADYLLPAYPLFAVAFGCAMEGWLESRANPRTVRNVQRATGGVLVAVTIVWAVMVLVVEPRAEAKQEQRHFAAAIRSHAPAPHTIVQFRMESHLLSYHLGMPLHTLVEWGDLDELLAAPGPHFVVMPPEYVFATGEIVKSRKLIEVARAEDYTRGKPSRPLVFLRTAD